MKKFVLTFIILLLSLTLFSEETIKDTIFSDPLLDGDITYHPRLNALEVNNDTQQLIAGDWTPFYEYPQEPEPNCFSRIYLSFDLPQIPDGYVLSNAQLRLYKLGENEGYNSYTGEFGYYPFWNIGEGGFLPCIVSHINYGESLDYTDWEKGDLENQHTIEYNIGEIDSYPTIHLGYKYLDVTESVENDYLANREKLNLDYFLKLIQIMIIIMIV